MNLKQALEKYLEQSGESPAKFAFRSTVSESTISRILREKQKGLSLSNLHKFKVAGFDPFNNE